MNLSFNHAVQHDSTFSRRIPCAHVALVNSNHMTYIICKCAMHNRHQQSGCAQAPASYNMGEGVQHL